MFFTRFIVLSLLWAWAPVAAFLAYDCRNASLTVEAYSLLDTQTCSEEQPDYGYDRQLTMEIVQLKSDRWVEVGWCRVYLTSVSQHCGMSSHAGPLRWHKLQELIPVPPTACRDALEKGSFILRGVALNATLGATVTQKFFSAGSLDRDSNCESGTLNVNGIQYKGQTGSEIYTVTVSREMAKVSDASGMIRLPGDILAQEGDLSAQDGLGGTFIWSRETGDCDDRMSFVYFGPVRVLTNSTKTLSGGLAVLEDPVRGQFAGLEIQEATVLCGYTAYRTHIRGVLILAVLGRESRISKSSFDPGTISDITRLETEISFLHVRTSMDIRDKIRQVRSAVCTNRVELARARLEMVAGTDKPYSLRRVFGPGHIAIKAGATVYVGKCQPVQVVPEAYPNCTSEIPVMLNGSRLFVDPITLVLQMTGTILPCSAIGPARWEIGGAWYCSYPEIRECHTPKKIPVDDVVIDVGSNPTYGLGKSLYSQAQQEEFESLRNTIGARPSYVADASMRAFHSRSHTGSLGSGLSEWAMEGIVERVGWEYIPFFWLFGVYASWALLVCLCFSVLNMVAHVLIRAYHISLVRGVGWWMVASLFGAVYHAVVFPFAWVRSRTAEIGEAALDRELRIVSPQTADRTPGRITLKDLLEDPSRVPPEQMQALYPVLHKFLTETEEPLLATAPPGCSTPPRTP